MDLRGNAAFGGRDWLRWLMGKPGMGIFLGLESARLASMCLDVMTSAEVFGEWEPLPEVNV